MSAHSHMDYSENARDSRGRFIPRPSLDAYVSTSQYTVTFSNPIGEFNAGDTLIFDSEVEPGAGDIVGLQFFEGELRDSVQVGKLITHLPTARWAEMPFGETRGNSPYTFAFQALDSETPQILDMACFVGIDICVEVQRAGETKAAPWEVLQPDEDTIARPRDKKGRFLKGGIEDNVGLQGEKAEAVDVKTPEDTQPATRRAAKLERYDAVEAPLHQLRLQVRLIEAFQQNCLEPSVARGATLSCDETETLSEGLLDILTRVNEIHAIFHGRAA